MDFLFSFQMFTLNFVIKIIDHFGVSDLNQPYRGDIE